MRCVCIPVMSPAARGLAVLRSFLVPPLQEGGEAIAWPGLTGQCRLVWLLV